MKRIFLSGATLAIGLMTGHQALGDNSETQEMHAMIAGIEFIIRNSKLEYAGQTLPDVTVLSEKELQLRFIASGTSVHASGRDQSGGRVAAFFDRHANQIFLSEVKSLTGPGLVHELVHFLQNVNGKGDMFVSHSTCLEAEAYELQALWQAETGIDLASMPDYGFIMTLNGICNDAGFSWIDDAQQH